MFRHGMTNSNAHATRNRFNAAPFVHQSHVTHINAACDVGQMPFKGHTATWCLDLMIIVPRCASGVCSCGCHSCRCYCCYCCSRGGAFWWLEGVHQSRRALLLLQQGHQGEPLDYARGDEGKRRQRCRWYVDHLMCSGLSGTHSIYESVPQPLSPRQYT